MWRLRCIAAVRDHALEAGELDHLVVRGVRCIRSLDEWLDVARSDADGAKLRALHRRMRPVANAWSFKSSMPALGSQTASLGRRIYVVTGSAFSPGQLFVFTP